MTETEDRVVEEGILQLYREVDLPTPHHRVVSNSAAVSFVHHLNTLDSSNSLNGSASQEKLAKKNKTRIHNRKRFFAFVLLTVAIICATLALTLFFLIPRKMSIAIVAVSSPLRADISSSNSIVSMDVDMLLTVRAENIGFVSLSVSKARVEALWIHSQTKERILFGTGVLDKVSISGRSKKEFTIPFSLNHEGNYSSDEMFTDFISRCTSNQRILEMTYKVYVDGNSEPVITANHTIGCPLNPDQVQSILNSISSSNGGIVKIPFLI